MLHILRHNSTLPLPKSVDQVSQNDLHTQLASQSTLDAGISVDRIDRTLQNKES